MSNNIFLGLVYNASLLLAMVLIFSLLTERIDRKKSFVWQSFAGILLGGIGLAVMLTNWQLLPGVVFDTRSVLLSITGMFFGLVPTVIAMLMTGIFRVVQGGSGMVMGVSVIVFSGILGLVWHFFRSKNLHRLTLREIYFFGLIVHVVMMACTFLLPESIRANVQRSIWLPVMSIYPVTTLLLGGLMSAILNRGLIVEKMKESEERYRTLIEQSSDGVIIISNEGSLLMSNLRWREMFGYTEKEVQGLNVESTYLPEERKLFKKRLKKVLTGGELHLKRKGITKSGQIITVEIDVKRIAESNIQVFMRDITKSVLDEAALRESEEMFSRVFKHSPEIVSISTLKGATFLDVNEAFTKELGYKKEEVIGKSALDFGFWINKEDRKKMIFELERKKILRNREFIFRRKNGESITCLCSMTTIRVKGKTCLLILAVNIEDRKRAEKELKRMNALILQEKQNFESVLQEMGDAVIVTDPEGKVVLVNKVMLNMCGSCAKKLLKNILKDTIPWKYETNGEFPDDIFRSVFVKKDTIRSKKTIVLTTHEGKSVLLDVVATPILKDGGEMVGSVWVLRDVTKEKELEKMRSDFISLASHQLRTPLTGIKWFVELLKEDIERIPLEKVREYVSKIGESSGRMNDLVNDLLTTSRADEGRLEKNINNYSVKDLLRQAIDAQGNLFLDRQMTVSGLEQIPEEIKIEVDKVQILQVLGNLLNNAVGYSSDKGTVEVGAKSDNGWVTVWVKDFGMGIPEAQKKNIFQKFFRADNVAKTVPGSGLGLYVAKSMVESHGGTISFESKENEGTTFFVKLPIVKTNGEKKAEE